VVPLLLNIVSDAVVVYMQGRCYQGFDAAGLFSWPVWPVTLAAMFNFLFVGNYGKR
jgi:hypothetical protein